jgi:hypothetical protein
VARRRPQKPAGGFFRSLRRIVFVLVFVFVAACIAFVALLLWPGDPAGLRVERLFAERSPEFFPVGTFTLLSGLIAAGLYWAWTKIMKMKQERARLREEKVKLRPKADKRGRSQDA